MKRTTYMALPLVYALFLQGCTHEDTPELEWIEKKITISFEGDLERVYPWISFAAHTENKETLWAVVDNDTTVCYDGVFGYSKGQIPQKQIALLTKQTKEAYWTRIAVAYRKRMDDPSPQDNLSVRIKGYRNNVLCLDTTHVMHAFERKYKPKSSAEYIYDIKF